MGHIYVSRVVELMSVVMWPKGVLMWAKCVVIWVKSVVMWAKLLWRQHVFFTLHKYLTSRDHYKSFLIYWCFCCCMSIPSKIMSFLKKLILTVFWELLASIAMCLQISGLYVPLSVIRLPRHLISFIYILAKSTWLDISQKFDCHLSVALKLSII